MEFTFFSASGQVLFVRNDLESGHWLQHEYSLTATFPFDAGKLIQRGQRIAFRDPATDNLEMYEIRQCVNTEPDHAQAITAEHIAVAELQDEHIDKAEYTDVTSAQALYNVLENTDWYRGGLTGGTTQNCDIARGSVWQSVNTICKTWNLYATPRIVLNSDGSIYRKYIDLSPAQGTFRGLRLSIRKNMLDASVTYNDEDVYTALYGYGGTNPSAGSTDEINFSDVVWTATDDHPAKPSGQTYLEDPAKTALYGRNGRPRFGYYQNGAITDPEVLLQKTWETLKTISEPKISISGTCADLKRLGYNDVPIRLHDLALVEIEETGEQFYKEIIMLDVDLVDPSNTRPDIGDYIPNIVYINRDTADKAGGGGGGGGHGQTNAEAEESDTFAMFEKTNDMIGMVVGTRNGGYYVKAGEIVLAINQDGGTNIKLQADTIDIDGIISSLTAKEIYVYALSCASNIVAQGRITANSGVWTDTLKVAAVDATWQSKTVVTGVTLSPTYTFIDKDGYERTGKLVTGVTTETIHYLGY